MSVLALKVEFAYLEHEPNSLTLPKAKWSAMLQEFMAKCSQVRVVLKVFTWQEARVRVGSPKVKESAPSGLCGTSGPPTPYHGPYPPSRVTVYFSCFLIPLFN